MKHAVKEVVEEGAERPVHVRMLAALVPVVTLRLNSAFCPSAVFPPG